MDIVSRELFETNQACVRRHLAAENLQDMEGTLATLHPDCVFEDFPLNKTYLGIEGVRQYYKELWAAFDITVENRLPHWSIDGSLIAETTFLGPQRGSFLGIPPKGREIRLPLVAIVTFRDGLMVGERFYYDLSLLLRQIGASGLPQIA